MRAMVLEAPGERLTLRDVEAPSPDADQVLVDVHTCGICRTDLHILDGELEEPTLPLIPGHQIVGTIVQAGERVSNLAPGRRIGIPWLGGSCGSCRHCTSQRENLCDAARYTGYQINGGFAERCVAEARFCFPIPDEYDDFHAAPLLCAGLIGHRALGMTGDARRLGFYGFGASAHILIQIARAQGREVSVFTRPGDAAAQQFARDLGAHHAADSGARAAHEFDAAIIFAPVGSLVPEALAAVRKGGVVVCAGIHMSEIPAFPYALLWGERVLRSVANLTRRDGEEFFEVVRTIPLRTEVHRYPLDRANEALEDLRHGRFTGAAVLEVQRGLPTSSP